MADGNFSFAYFFDPEDSRSNPAIERLREICRKHLSDPFEIQLFDLRQQPDLLDIHGIQATPTLIITKPGGTMHRFVGFSADPETFILAAGMGQTALRMRRDTEAMMAKSSIVEDKT